MRLKGVQNGGKQRTQRTKRTGGKSRPPIWPISPIGPISPHEKRYAGLVSKMRVMGVQNGGARFAEVESKKRGQVESGKTRKSPQTSQSSQYSQTHCADRVSKKRLRCVQNGGMPASRECAPLAGPANAGEKRGQVESMEPENTIPDFQTHYADMVSRLSRMLDSVKKILQRLPGILIYLLGKAILTG